MKHINCEQNWGLLIIMLARGKANALNHEMVDELLEVLGEAGRDPQVRGVVLASSSPRFFSGGFDVAEVFSYDRPKMKEFFGRFIDLYEGFYKLPKPVVGAISGHAYAGGAVLALSCDYRVMAEGSFGFALNEIELGVVLPSGIARMAMHVLGPRAGTRMLLSGQPLTPEQALDCGLADEKLQPEAVLARAIERARALAAKAPGAFAGMKTLTRELAGYGAAISDRQELDHFLDSWFSPEAEERKHVLTQSLRA
jgi:3,2-trans-enoyl-CoA isomerase